MADIVSRIRVEAHGADQAAREIRKLKEAYDQVAQSARGLSADVGSGGRDPFSRAVAAGGGAIEGGNTPADISHRESRTRLQHDLQNSRESANRNYNSALRPQSVAQGFSTADDVSQGRGASAAGGLAGAMGSLLGGPAGIALAIAGAVGVGVQRLADTAYGRLESTFGSGMSQRLGLSWQDTSNQMIGFGRMGVNEQSVNSFFNAASQSGVNFGATSTQGATNAAMLAAVSLGIDPSTVAGLIGSLNQVGVNAANVGGERMYGMASGSFGVPNVALFAQSLQGMVSTMGGRGIDLTTSSANAMAVQMAALSSIGGFSAPGASSFAQQLQGRGIQAAGLQSPEDIMAFQLMREEGESVTQTMIRMEENPMAVNRAVLDHLEQISGGNIDTLRFHVQDYLGAGTTMSTADRFITTHRGMEGKTQRQLEDEFGAGYDMYANLTEDQQNAMMITSVKQAKLTKEAEDAALLLSTRVAGDFQNIFGHDKTFDPRDMTRSGHVPLAGMSSSEIEDRLNLLDVDQITIDGVGNLVLAFDGLSVKEAEHALNALENMPGMANAYSAMQHLKDNTFGIYDLIDDRYSRTTGRHGNEWQYTVEALQSEEGVFNYGTAGNWAAIGTDLITATMGSVSDMAGRRNGFRLEDREAREAHRVMRDEVDALYPGMNANLSMQELVNLLLRFETIVSNHGFRYTDGEWSYGAGER